jgi:hypothetical protein
VKAAGESAGATFLAQKDSMLSAATSMIESINNINPYIDL